MPWFMLVPFGIFFVCCFLQFWFTHRIQMALVRRHPKLWLRLSDQPWYRRNPIWRYTWSGDHRDLGDDDLSAKIFQFRLLSFVAFASWGVMVLGIITGFGFGT